MEVADRIVVLRKGRVVGRLRKEEASIPGLAKLMVGREVLFRLEKRPVSPGDVALEIRGLKAIGDKGVLALRGIWLKVRRGEIIGIAGVAGNGQKELVEVIYGLRKSLEGKITLFGQDMTRKPTSRIIRLGTSLIPEDRLRRGIIPNFSVSENLVLESIDSEPFSSKLMGELRKLNEAEIERHAEELIKKFNIVTPSTETRAITLSGGNIQRLILARELSRKPSLIIAEEPTAGLDVAAAEFIRKLLLKARERMSAILLVSGDLSEILSLSDKVAVMYEGEITGTFRPGEVSIDEIGLMMTGAKRMPKEKVINFWEL